MQLNLRDFVPLEASREILPWLLLLGVGALEYLSREHPHVIAHITIEARIAVAAMVVLHLISRERAVSKSRGHVAGLNAKLKNVAAIKTLPREFNVKLVMMLMATPDEVADCLVSELKRPKWELNLRSVSKLSSAPHTLELQYVNSQTKYEVLYSLQLLKPLEGKQGVVRFLICESVLFNKGQQTQTRLYLLEEVANKPYFLRLTLFARTSAESEARTLVR